VHKALALGTGLIIKSFLLPFFSKKKTSLTFHDWRDDMRRYLAWFAAVVAIAVVVGAVGYRRAIRPRPVLVARPVPDQAAMAAARLASARAALDKAKAAILAGDFPRAMAQAGAALALGEPAGHLYRGEAEAHVGSYRDALADETAYLAIHRDSWEALYWRAVAERHGGALVTAANDLTASLAINADDAPAWAELGLVAWQRMDLPGAYYDETRALDLFPAGSSSRAMVLSVRATAEVQLLRYADAKVDAEAALAGGAEPAWRAMALKDLGYVSLKSGEYPMAVEALTEAETLSPGDAQIAAWLAAAKLGPRTHK